MNIRLQLFRLVVFSLFFLCLLLILNSSELPSPEVDSSLSEKPILETSGYFFLQSNTLLPISSINSDEIFPMKTSQKETIIAIVTGYWLVEEETDDDPCIVASGLNACEVDKNIVACPRKYPFGTKVLINGIVYTCEDRTNIKYDGVFDILFNTEEEVKNWGKRILPVTIFN